MFGVCSYPVFGTDKKTGMGYCKNHQRLRTDLDRRTSAQKIMDKIREGKQQTPEKEKSELEKWFEERRKEMTGVCQCGCKKPSQKNDNKYFKYSCCHIFPKAMFRSIATHKLNYVERAFWGGCHTNMDTGGIEKWTSFADWQDIKEKFYELAPELTDKERATKYYSILEKMVYAVQDLQNVQD